MSLAAALTKADHKPARSTTVDGVTLYKVGDGYKITTIRPRRQVNVPGRQESAFRHHALAAKENRSGSRALTGAEIELHSTLD